MTPLSRIASISGTSSLRQYLVLRRPHHVQMEDVDVVGAQTGEGLPEGHPEPGGVDGRTTGVILREADLGRQDNLVAPSLKRTPDNLLGPIDLGRVEVGDPELERSAHDPDRLLERSTLTLAKTAVTAAAESGDTDRQSRSAKDDGLHRAKVIDGRDLLKRPRSCSFKARGRGRARVISLALIPRKALMTITLSMLDLAQIRKEQSPGDTLAISLAVAQQAERHGYRRVWYAEHHNNPTIASSATSLVIGYVAS